MNVADLPTSIPFSKLAATCDLLGIPKKDVQGLTLNMKGLTVTVLLRDGHGKSPLPDQALTTAVHIPIARHDDGGGPGAAA